jgi:hypothetical protein
MYPNGAIDNSWGTRSYKWMLESGTKTAPGIYFTYGLLADKDPAFQRGAQLALKFLQDHYINDAGWIVYGPHAFKHTSSTPPSNYSTFARAQSIATVVEYGPDASDMAPTPGQTKDWFKYFPTAKVGVGRTDQVMATVTAYRTGNYGGLMVGGGSASAVWFQGYGPTGFIQVSSQPNYQRQEPRHMPTESNLLPLTPRIETRGGTYHANIYDSQATVSFTDAADGFVATSSGALRTSGGASSGISFTWRHSFGPASYSKELQVSAAQSVQIVEPFVDNPGNQYSMEGDAFRITTAEGGVWELKVDSSTSGHELSHGTDRNRYWVPFPGIECYPVIIRLTGTGNATVKYTVSRVSP